MGLRVAVPARQPVCGADVTSKAQRLAIAGHVAPKIGLRFWEASAGEYLPREVRAVVDGSAIVYRRFRRKGWYEHAVMNTTRWRIFVESGLIVFSRREANAQMVACGWTPETPTAPIREERGEGE